MHTGRFMGKCDAAHSMSRSGQSMIETDRGGVIFTHETPDVQAGTRVAFEHGISALCEQVAVNVKALSQPESSKAAVAKRVAVRG